MYAKKSLGQHFLMHASIAERMVHVAGVEKTDTVLEIGPGRGLLTRILLANASKVVAIETDHELIPVLQEEFATQIAEGLFQLIEGDVRAFDPSTIREPYKLVANIPYYITGEIIRQFLTTPEKPTSITLLVQKEVAERIARSKKESLLSLSVKAFGVPKYQFTVPRGAFTPAPTIDSAVLTISAITTPFKSIEAEKHFFNILHAGFAHKRKQLAKNLAELTSPDALETAFENVSLAPTVRAEDVSLATWLRLAKELP
jgi:16S rRNA (adenine1518-N6/adenine1519-N6)-dimethyltransferase